MTKDHFEAAVDVFDLVDIRGLPAFAELLEDIDNPPETPSSPLSGGPLEMAGASKEGVTVRPGGKLMPRVRFCCDVTGVDSLTIDDEI